MTPQLILHPSTTLIDWVPLPKRPDIIGAIERRADLWRRRRRDRARAHRHGAGPPTLSLAT